MAITTRVIGTIKQCQPYFYAEIKGFLIFLSQINRALEESQHLFKAPRCSDRIETVTDWQAGFVKNQGAIAIIQIKQRAGDPVQPDSCWNPRRKLLIHGASETEKIL
jgi:hypothetical protein